jgi:hypothetical protein
MSAAEIADNKWELQAAKAPVGTFGGLMQLLLMTGFALFFVWIVGFSVIAIITPPNEDSGLASEFQKMKAEGNAAPAGEQKVEAE